MRRPHGIPADLDAGTAARITATLLVVRIVRGGLLVLFLATAAAGVEARGWPHAVTAAVAAAAVLVAARAVADARRLRAARRQRTG